MADLKILWAAALLAACSPPTGGGGGDDDDTSEVPEGACYADALEDDVPLSDDIDELVTRWDINTDMASFLFVGEPL
jgi:hypothetical protein